MTAGQRAPGTPIEDFSRMAAAVNQLVTELAPAEGICMEHTRASLAPVRQITAAGLIACGLAAPAAVAGAGRGRIGEAEIAFETLGRSGPVVVFESGRGEDMRSWDHVARALAACARAVLSDRPGLGRTTPRTGGRASGRGSPRPGPSALLADTVVDQLAALLHAIDMPPRYILVGHSLG